MMMMMMMTILSMKTLKSSQLVDNFVVHFRNYPLTSPHLHHRVAGLRHSRLNQLAGYRWLRRHQIHPLQSLKLFINESVKQERFF